MLLHEKLASLRWGRKNCLLDTLSSALSELPQDEYRRVAVIVSNGEDDCSRTKEKTVVKIARQNGVIIYALDTSFSLTHQAREVF